MPNHDLAYRPLRAGTSILNARVNEPGTLGLIAQDAAGAAWIVSCYHVLCDVNLGAYVQDDPIYQPAAVVNGNQIAVTSKTMADAGLDCAAAKVMAGIQVSNSILEIGPVTGVVAATAGMRVVKSGGVSGITEGVVANVAGQMVTIRIDASFSQQYVLSEPGDSGALWVEQTTQRAVALHRGLQTAREAAAVPVQLVMDKLGLKLM